MYEGASGRSNGALNGMSLRNCTFQPSKLHSLDHYSKWSILPLAHILFSKNEVDMHACMLIIYSHLSLSQDLQFVMGYRRGGGYEEGVLGVGGVWVRREAGKERMLV